MARRRRRDHHSRRRRDHHRSKHWYRAVSALAKDPSIRDARRRTWNASSGSARGAASGSGVAMTRGSGRARGDGLSDRGVVVRIRSSRLSPVVCPVAVGRNVPQNGLLLISRSPARTLPHDAAPPRVVVVVVAMAAAEERDIDELELLTKLNSTNPADRIEARRQVRARRRVVVESHPIPSNSVAPSSSRVR